jgi:hypothetical protein
LPDAFFFFFFFFFFFDYYLAFLFIGIPTLESLGPWLPWKYGPETWEHVVFHDTLTRLVFVASFTAFQSNRNQNDHSLLRLAAKMYDYLLQPEHEKVLRSEKLIRADDYRGSGIIYGQLAKLKMTEGPFFVVATLFSLSVLNVLCCFVVACCLQGWRPSEQSWIARCTTAGRSS